MQPALNETLSGVRDSGRHVHCCRHHRQLHFLRWTLVVLSEPIFHMVTIMCILHGTPLIHIHFQRLKFSRSSSWGNWIEQQLKPWEPAYLLLASFGKMVVTTVFLFLVYFVVRPAYNMGVRAVFNLRSSVLSLMSSNLTLSLTAWILLQIV